MKIPKIAAIFLATTCLLAACAAEKPSQETPVSHVWISKDGSIILNGITVQRNSIVKTLKERGISEDEDILIFFARGTEVKYLTEVQTALVNAGYLWTRTSPMTSSAVIPGARNWAPNQVPADTARKLADPQH